MAYSDRVLDHYENPRNVGSFAKTEDLTKMPAVIRDTSNFHKSHSQFMQVTL